MTCCANPLQCTAAQFVAAERTNGVSATNALQSYRALYRRGDTTCLGRTPIRAPQHIEREGDTTRFTLEHGQRRYAESVIIPYRRNGRISRTTLCVSSQVGCAMGCTFCQTAQLGLLKNLSTAEIVEQWFVARHGLDADIDNIVFMGMGEPMDNLDAVLDSITVLTDRNGAAIAPSRITISTVGRCHGIRRLAAFTRRPGFGRLRLAVSVNAPNDTIRSRLMPINRAEPMEALRDAMLAWPSRILIEYVLIPGENMDLTHADQLADYLSPLRCSVNLIPYNPRRDSPWPAPQQQAIDAFTNRLLSHGLWVRRRRTTGRDVAAACGQLGAATPADARRRPARVTVTTSPVSHVK